MRARRRRQCRLWPQGCGREVGMHALITSCMHACGYQCGPGGMPASVVGWDHKPARAHEECVCLFVHGEGKRGGVGEVRHAPQCRPLCVAATTGGKQRYACTSQPCMCVGTPLGHATSCNSWGPACVRSSSAVASAIDPQRCMAPVSFVCHRLHCKLCEGVRLLFSTLKRSSYSVHTLLAQLCPCCCWCSER